LHPTGQKIPASRTSKLARSFLPFRYASPSVLFFCHSFCATAYAAHCFFFFQLKIILAVKKKNQRAAPTHKQKPTPKNKTQSYIYIIPVIRAAANPQMPDL